ncbi:hypothetical protein MTO96_032970, partial [Rhipicephalus appendiculatus]
MKAAYLLALTAMLLLATSMGIQGSPSIAEERNGCD